MAIKKGLGRGFDSLIPTDVLDETFDPTADRDEQVSELRYIKLDVIEPNPDQPRRVFEEEALEELADSIREHGVVQPIVVAPGKNGQYVIVAGERRWRASKLAGQSKIPALVRTISNQHKLELALIENLQRKDLNPLETATAYLKLKTQFNMTQEEIGKRVGNKSTGAISNIMRLLQLPDFAKKALVDGTISEGHARQILALAGDERAQKDLLKHIVLDGWSVRKAEQYVIGYKKSDQAAVKKQDAVRSTRTETDFTKRLATRLSLPVIQKTTARGGQIIITYKNEDELKTLESRLF
jgi:ParB family chromosome partitioning protein